MRAETKWMLVAWLAIGAGAASAQSPADSVVQQLREQGYVEFAVSRTLLGRTRVTAIAPNGGQREIVFNPATGEILRDYLEAGDGAPAPMVLDRSDDGSPRMASAQDKDGGEDGLSRQDDDPPPRAVGQGRSPSPRQGRDAGSNAKDDRPRQQDDEDDGDEDRPRQRNDKELDSDD